MERLTSGVAAGLRASVALLGAVAALLGLAPPARPAWVLGALSVSLLWTVAFVRVALHRGLQTWSTCLEVALTTALCLVQTRITAADALPAGAGWVEVSATITIVICHFTWRLPVAVAGGLVVLAGYLIGARSAGLADHGLAQAAIFAIQILCAGLLMALIRRAATTADTTLTERAALLRQAEVGRARRAAERHHNRQLHDTVLATLTMVGVGAIDATSASLRSRAHADLGLIDGFDPTHPVVPAPRRPSDAGLIRLHEKLHLVTATFTDLRVDLTLTGCLVPATVADAFAGAAGEALVNVARHAGTAAVRVGVRATGDTVTVEVTDAGTGFDPDRVPPARYGIREAIVGRMRAVGGEARVTSTPGAGTRVSLVWHRG
jgi:signal transduction histidine kinase